MFKQRPKIKIVLLIILTGAAFITGRNLLIKRQEARHTAPSNEQILQIDIPDTDGSYTFVEDIDWRTDSPQIAFATGLTLYVYNLQDDDLEILVPSVTTIASIAWSPDNSKLAMGAWELYLWDPETGDMAIFPDLGGGYYTAIAWDPSSRYIASSFHNWREGNIYVRDTLTNSVRTLEVEGMESSYLHDWSPQGESLAVSEDSHSEINIVRLDTGTILETLNNSGRSATWSPDGEHVLTGRKNSQNLLIWDASTWQVETILRPLSQIIGSDWHPTGHYVATATDRGVRIWNIDTGDYFAIQTGPALKVAWSPDGDMLAVGTQDKLFIWRISELP